jgi:Domain of unknown function (DUF1858)/Uncharacterized conserved protein (DUF2249)
MKDDKCTIINENDTIYDIVNRYPGMKEKLGELSPAFNKLNNPVLFNTVAKVTTIKKAAGIGKVYLREMLYQLNDFIGRGSEYLALAKKEILNVQNDFLQKKFAANQNEVKEPDWLGEAEKFENMDVRGMLEDPFTKVIEKAQIIQAGGGFILIQKFEPLPLISYLESLGFDHYTKIASEREFWIYFLKKVTLR